MSYSVRHQVFVSSTFTDLVEERAEVIQAIWEMDCIPTGMEAFVASNESQWDVIKRVIDECDYYVLIIGGRYGSVTDEGISYTEKEFRYAKKSGIPVLAFVHADPDQIPAGKSEKDGSSRKKLIAFREEVMKVYPVKTYSTPLELGGFVSRSLIREIKVNPRPGWIRNDGSSPIALLEQINKLTEENRALRETVETDAEAENIDDLQSGDDRFTIEGVRDITNKVTHEVYVEDWAVEVTWDTIFRAIGPSLIDEATQQSLAGVLQRFHRLQPLDEGYALSTFPDIKVSLETWNAVLIQFRALGLMDIGTKKRAVSDKSSYWRITPKGDRYLISLFARRKSPKNDANDLFGLFEKEA